jgi:hypothetical protein
MFDSPVVVIGGAFGLLASVNAFLIAYDHGKLRRYSGRALWLKPIYAAAAALGCFAMLIFALLLLSRYLL